MLSVVLFFISASDARRQPARRQRDQAALTSGGPMLFSPNNILVVGLDNRPTTGYSSKEAGGANHSEADANTDTMMLWRIGGGVSRTLSIPRDTLVDIPGATATAKINAAWACGGPKATIQAVESLTGLKINHMIVVDLGNFPKFIDDIGGVTVKTPRICSKISGGAADGGYTLNLQPGHPPPQRRAGADARPYARQLVQPRLHRHQPREDAAADHERRSRTSCSAPRLHPPALGLVGRAQGDPDRHGRPDTDAAVRRLGDRRLGAEPHALKETGGYYNGEDVLIPNTAERPAPRSTSC